MDIEAIYNQAFQLRCDGRYSEALPLFQRILQLDPSHIGARHQIGLIEGFTGDFDASLATLQTLSQQYPSNLDVLYDFAMTQMMLGMFDEACSNIRKILSINPSHQKALEQSSYC